ncbi:MAG TPA: Asp23/Gls24 family envelope stress response protein [Diaminobutyricibacter sp.]|jgi:uncharacterized alkaline shock family protein YloU
MEGTASISAEILARYAADAAREIAGVRELHGRHAVKVDDDLRVEVHVEVEWGASIPEVGKGIQDHVHEYLLRMADVEPVSVEVVIDAIGPR